MPSLIIGDGLLELDMLLEDVLSVPQSGPADEAIEYLMGVEYIRNQVDRWPETGTRDYAWDMGYDEEEGPLLGVQRFVLWCMITDAQEVMRNLGLMW